MADLNVSRREVSVEKKTELDILTEAFDALITKGKITREVDISGLVKLTMSPLSTSQFLEADTVYIAAVPNVPADVVARVRTVSCIVHSIVAINGKPVPTGTEDEKSFRDSLFAQFMKLPPAVLDNLAAEYRSLVDEQRKLFTSMEDVVENF